MTESERSLCNICSVLQYCNHAMPILWVWPSRIDYNTLQSVVVHMICSGKIFRLLKKKKIMYVHTMAHALTAKPGLCFSTASLAKLMVEIIGGTVLLRLKILF